MAKGHIKRKFLDNAKKVTAYASLFWHKAIDKSYCYNKIIIKKRNDY